MNVVKMRRCEKCHQIHDCQFYSETKAKKKTKVEDELTRPDVGDWND